jgi:hypothetical protein
MELSTIHNSAHGAASLTAAIKHDAERLGFTNVQTGYEPPTGMHTVTGTPPVVPDTPPTGH